MKSNKSTCPWLSGDIYCTLIPRRSLSLSPFFASHTWHVVLPHGAKFNGRFVISTDCNYRPFLLTHVAKNWHWAKIRWQLTGNKLPMHTFLGREWLGCTPAGSHVGGAPNREVTTGQVAACQKPSRPRPCLAMYNSPANFSANQPWSLLQLGRGLLERSFHQVVNNPVNPLKKMVTRFTYIQSYIYKYIYIYIVDIDIGR